uniref:ATP synthase subunit 8 n=1 Tax=Peronia peronii TaxID=999236 RepID=G8HQW5_9EUPU|nr:ATP synthase F0 subunit 8 [Peronia peronii]AEQ93873.1 ATP synthase subunit 8 [Peronia peronii]
MPQLAPTLGYLVFFFILGSFSYLVISNSKTTISPKVPSSKQTLKNGPQFF